ncbi:MAG: hypothetical protein WAP74_00155 [Patescibacteria group bacterium]
MAKDTTLNELVELTAHGFADVTERIMTVDSKVDRQTVQLSNVETRLERIENTMLELAYKYEVRRLEDRVAKIEKAIGLIKR